MHEQGVKLGVLNRFVVVVLAGSITAMRTKERNLELKSNGKPD